MKKIYAKRLLKVAQACRETTIPQAFTMEKMFYGDTTERGIKPKFSIGTPACALGLFASRKDLQRIMEIKLIEYEPGRQFAAATIPGTGGRFSGERLRRYFGLDETEYACLFYSKGCGRAKTAIQAAEFIEFFVKNATSGKS
jgi:hypothetical protein